MKGLYQREYSGEMVGVPVCYENSLYSHGRDPSLLELYLRPLPTVEQEAVRSIVKEDGGRPSLQAWYGCACSQECYVDRLGHQTTSKSFSNHSLKNIRKSLGIFLTS